ETNWFSAPSALKVYGQYLNLDKDHNGMLSKKELQRYGTGVLTSVFIERLFEECLTYDGEMDYKTYLDFVLALENRKEPQALQYFFRILDVGNQGYLTTFSLSYFFRAIQDQLKSLDQDPVSFSDIKDELFDMIKPQEPDRITLKDLCRSGQGDVLVSVLIDLNGFSSMNLSDCTLCLGASRVCVDKIGDSRFRAGFSLLTKSTRVSAYLKGSRADTVLKSICSSCVNDLQKLVEIERKYTNSDLLKEHALSGHFAPEFHTANSKRRDVQLVKECEQLKPKVKLGRMKFAEPRVQMIDFRLVPPDVNLKSLEDQDRPPRSRRMSASMNGSVSLANRVRDRRSSERVETRGGHQDEFFAPPMKRLSVVLSDAILPEH
ncbi:unnamed protein product, partial [Notodromas monacha]